MLRRKKVKKTKLPKTRKTSYRRKPRKSIPILFILSILANILFVIALVLGISRGDFKKILQMHKSSHGTKTHQVKIIEADPLPVAVKIEKIKRTILGKRTLSPGKPKLIFIIDDMGHSRDNEKLFRELEDNVVYAILPFLPYSKYFSDLSKKTKAEVMLHLPLEALDETFPGPGLITTRMSEGNILDLLDRNLKTVPRHVGANSHMGSKGTTDRHLMEIILRDFKKRRLFFLDSYTSSGSVVARLQKKIGLPVLKRDIFLDNIDRPSEVRKRIQELASVATKQGWAIGIGHDRHNTLRIIMDRLPHLKENGYEVISLEDLIWWRKKIKR